MLPSEVTVSQVRDGVEFDKQSNPIKYQEYTFFVANHGPFSERFYAGEQTADQVAARINARVQTLRQLGILTQS